MIRSVCQFKNESRCSQVTRARRIHKFCRVHHLEVNGVRRSIPHQMKKERVIRTKPVKVIVQSSKRSKRKNSSSD